MWLCEPENQHGMMQFTISSDFKGFDFKTILQSLQEVQEEKVLSPDMESCHTIRSVKQEAAEAEGSGRTWPLRSRRWGREGDRCLGRAGRQPRLLTSCYFWWAARQSWRKCWRLQLMSPTLSAGQLEKNERNKESVHQLNLSEHHGSWYDSEMRGWEAQAPPSTTSSFPAEALMRPK